MWRKVLIFQFLVPMFVGAQHGPLLKTNVGEFEGKLLDFDDGHKVETYFGLPFAATAKRFEVCLFNLI